MEIHLVRHGKTLATEQRLYCGQNDLPLTESGVNEILFLKEQGVYPPADLFFSSGMLRAEQTLSVICGDMDRKIVPGLAEICIGTLEMKNYDELRESEDYQAWVADETGDLPCPGGESRNGFRKRVFEGYDSVVDEVSQSVSRNAFVVCHGGTISTIMEQLFSGVSDYQGWLPKPGRGFTLIYESGRIERYKDI